MTGSIRWLGHAFFEYTTADGKTVLFDPWTADDGNPACPVETAAVDRADLILVSHDHFDHIGSAGGDRPQHRGHGRSDGPDGRPADGRRSDPGREGGQLRHGLRDRRRV